MSAEMKMYLRRNCFKVIDAHVVSFLQTVFEDCTLLQGFKVFVIAINQRSLTIFLMALSSVLVI